MTSILQISFFILSILFIYLMTQSKIMRNFKYDLNIFLINKQFLIILFYIIAIKYITVAYCDVEYITKNNNGEQEMIIPDTENNRRIVATQQVREILLMINIVKNFAIEIRNLSENAQVPLFTPDGEMRQPLYNAIRELITKIITVYGEEQFNTVIDFLVTNREGNPTRDTILNEIIAIYIGIKENPNNRDEYGSLINVQGKINFCKYYDYLKYLNLTNPYY